VVSRHYAKVRDRISKEDFEAKVKAKVGEWGGLLDTDAAALLVLEEMGVDVAEWTPIAEIEENAEVSIRGEVTAITPMREFTRQDGTKGRVVNVTVKDATGSCRVVLWDDDVGLVAEGRLKVRGFLRCLDCFVRRTNFGVEVGRGKFGALLPE
jgi:replication factor A1